MANIIGRGVRLEIGVTFGTPKVVTAVTLAATGVATSTAHAMVNGTVGFWSGVTGMVQLEGQATRVFNQATNTFELQGLNTTSYSAFTAGNFTPVSTWATLAPATSLSVGGGEANKLNATRLIDVITQEENGLLAPQTITVNVLSEDVNSQAQQLIDDAALAQGYLVFRVTFANGTVRVFRGSPSLSNEDIQQGALANGSFNITIKGIVLKGAA